MKRELGPKEIDLRRARTIVNVGHTARKKPKGEKEWFGRILLILEMLWDLLTLSR